MTSKAYRVACNYVLGLLDAEVDFALGLKKAIYYCQYKFTAEDYTDFINIPLIEAEKKHLNDWMSSILSDFKPPLDLIVLWFYLVCEVTSANNYIIDFCFAGDSQKDKIGFNMCGPGIPEYLPANHLAHSPLLGFWAEKIDKLPFESRFLSEYILGMTYAILAARDLCKLYAADLGQEKKTVMAGFALGDGIIVGQVIDRYFYPQRNKSL